MNNFNKKYYKVLSRLDSHQRIYISLIPAIISFLFFFKSSDLILSIILAWDVFSVIDLLLIFSVIPKDNLRETIRNAKLQDAGRTTILLFILTAATSSFVAVAILLKSAKPLDNEFSFFCLVIALATVILSWCLVHTIFTIHYAHIFYGGENKASNHTEGLVFPNEVKPTFADFIYFSFGIGTTFQVADVQITSRRIRKLVTIHGIISFGYNTFILALVINILAGLF